MPDEPGTAPGPDNWDPAAELRMILANREKLEGITGAVRSLLPPGTHFAVLIEVPAPKGQWGRVIALSTDAERMARYAGQWVLHAFPHWKDKGKPR